VPARADAHTLFDGSSLCIENVSPDLARQVRAAEPLLTRHELPPSTRCADLHFPVFAGYLRGSESYIPSEPGSPGLARVHTGDYLTAYRLCQMSLVVECVLGSPAGGSYTDLWWNPDESGWGLSVTHHTSGTVFAVWFTYDAQGASKWYVAPDCRVFLVGCESKLYETTGPAFGPVFDPSRVRAREVGTLRLSFTGAPSTMSYVVDGQAGTRAISRQPF
jgi:hypothetical protein